MRPELPTPPEPGMIYRRLPSELHARDLLTDEIRDAGNAGCAVVVTEDGIWWRPYTTPPTRP